MAGVKRGQFLVEGREGQVLFGFNSSRFVQMAVDEGEGQDVFGVAARVHVTKVGLGFRSTESKYEGHGQ